MIFAAALLFQTQALPVVKLSQGQVIQKSCQVASSVYTLPNPDESWKKAAVVVRGNNITVDFKNATMAGGADVLDPDQRKGLGLLVEGNNITIRNLKIRGYKVGLLARKCTGLKLIDCNFSYNWKQRLMSTLEKEDESDWMSFHKNEGGEWLRYGAGAYLDECTGFEVKNLRVNGGQCGLLLNKSNKGLVWNSDLSFNSGLGLGMYRSSENRIMHNKMDWCVRGYSHGVYNRGQDSAGILVFEQCNKNTFAYNSATHGGDGFFLWAGQTTMDTGQGGCNDNLLYGNDLSHSPANAIEATFSRNNFVMNKLLDCWHGVWGGYSYDSVIMGNVFGLNGESIAIEHGQNNVIKFNQFRSDTVSIYLWQNAGQPDPNWGYPKHRDTANKGTVVSTNLFQDISDIAVHLGAGSDIKVHQNSIVNAATVFKIEGQPKNVDVTDNQIANVGEEPKIEVAKYEGNVWGPGAAAPKPTITRGGNSLVANELSGKAYLEQFDVRWVGDEDMLKMAREAKQERSSAAETIAEIAKYYVKPLIGHKEAFLPEVALRGRKYMLVDEWGPYDFKRPLLWPRTKASAGDNEVRTFELLGPKGTWKLKSKSNGVTGPTTGQLPGEVQFSWPTNAKNVKIELEYTGGATTDTRGIVTPAGKPVLFGWSKSFLPIEWSVKYWSWDESRDPRTRYSEFTKWMDTAPIATSKGNELSFATGGSPFEKVPADHFMTLAEGVFEVDAGSYVMNVTADDGVKVWVDGKLLIDEWHWQAPTLFTRELTLKKGRHQVEVQHFEIDGYTALKVELKPKKG